MNLWVERSIKLANRENYLYGLSGIYPPIPKSRKPLDPSVRRQIAIKYKARKGTELLQLLIEITHDNYPFPIEHPYASIFRQKPELIMKNRKMAGIIGTILQSMPYDEIIRGIERPIDLNRSLGSAFQNWIRDYFPTKGIPVLPEGEFLDYRGRAFLQGSDTTIKNYVNKRLRIPMKRGRDFLYKNGKGRYVIAEARFLSTAGGSQNRDIRETIQFIQSLKKPVTAIGVIDGIVWFEQCYLDLLTKLSKNESAISVLLLEKYLRSLG